MPMPALGGLIVALLLSACGQDAATDQATGAAADQDRQEASSTEQDSQEAPATDYPTELEPLVQQARDENGSVSLFVGSGGFSAEEAARLSADVAAYFGLDGIQVTPGAQEPHPPYIQRIIDEASQGVQPDADLVISSAAFSLRLAGEDLIEPVDWTSYEVDDALVEQAVSGILINEQPFGIVYNPDMVAEEDVPETYLDVIDERWRGQICTPAFGEHFAVIANSIGVDETTELVEGLIDLDVRFVQSYTDPATRVASGEFPLCVGAMAGQLKDTGAPVDNAPLRDATVDNFYASLLSTTEVPARATLLAYYLHTSGGQEAMKDILSWGRQDIPGTHAYDMVERGAHLTAASGDFYVKEMRELSARFGAMLGVD